MIESALFGFVFGFFAGLGAGLGLYLCHRVVTWAER